VTQGLAEVIKEYGPDAMKRGVAIAYDSRLYSDDFAKTAALVLAQNNIKAYLFESLRPTPELSFTVRKLNAISGIVVTASHNPKDYNGYKVYWEEGSQILPDKADKITQKINEINDFSKIKLMKEEEAISEGLLKIIGSEIDDEYISSVKKLSLRDDIDKNIKIVYTPLNGAGNKLVRRILQERGFNNISVVKEQENPDPYFTNIKYPNPEDINAFEYAMKLGKDVNGDILIATDPDCDRVGVMVKDNNNNYIALNGNQTGAILIKYILEALNEKNQIPNNGVIVKSIVTGDLGKEIAKSYNVDTIETLTGFKNICGKANEYEKTNEFEFIFGYEESIGYVYRTAVRDKDGVLASMVISEAAAYYLSKGKTLLDVLKDIYESHGYYGELLFSVVLKGIEGKERIERMMESFRNNYILKIKESKLIKYIDYNVSKVYDLENKREYNLDLSKTNGLKFVYDDESWYSIRPSGTEPKIKIYIYVKEDSFDGIDKKIKEIESSIKNKLNNIK